MHERHHNTSNRRRDHEQLLPLHILNDDDGLDVQNSPYYTIDNIEDGYDTKLLQSQQCYADPWDMETYDYAHRKIDLTTPSQDYYSDTSSPVYKSSPTGNICNRMYCNISEPRPTLQNPYMPPVVHMQRPHTSLYEGKYRDIQETCSQKSICNCTYFNNYNDQRIINYDQHHDRDYHISLSPKIPHNTYYNCKDSTSTIMNRHSSLQRHGALERSVLKFAVPPQVEFVAPQPLKPVTYDYCHPYVSSSHYNTSNCYECLSQLYKTQSLYASIPRNGCCSPLECPLISSSTLGRRRSSTSLYSTIYGHKFGLSNKGLLQIDYSCSWLDLNRAMCRNC